ncbi:B12-binding domain-containing radical SAM protein [Candidatus Pacearchaeota archaeon]|nr:B12-binding domain-containing radical SAM protein [Candidatus Pacearchaeota archaeon]
MVVEIDFIFPSSEYLFNPFRGDPHTHFQILSVLEWYFKDKVKLRLTDLRGVKREFFKYRIPKADIFLHSVYTLDYEEQKYTVEELKKIYPNALHVAGGPHVHFYKEDSLKLFDTLILGDGEESIIQLVNDYINGSIKRIYEQSEKIDINKYPIPKRHYLPQSAVSRENLLTLRNTPNFDKLLSTTVIFSRGCTHSCSFCAMPSMKKYNPGVRYKNPENVKEEIEYLKKEFNIQGISLLDEIGIPPSKNLAIPYLEAIKSTKIPWKAQCRVDNIDEEIAKLAKDSGCVTMCLGVESAVQECLDRINKKINIEKTKQSIKLLKQNKIETRLYMILGMPGEPEDIVEQTWKFIEETDPVSVYLSLFTVRPGTDIFDNPKKYGMKWINTDWSKTMHMYSRYDKELPSLTFEYEKDLPWGNKSISKEQIVKNYLKLQDMIIKSNRGPV